LRLNPGSKKAWAEAKSPGRTKNRTADVTALADACHGSTTFCQPSR